MNCRRSVVTLARVLMLALLLTLAAAGCASGNGNGRSLTATATSATPPAALSASRPSATPTPVATPQASSTPRPAVPLPIARVTPTPAKPVRLKIPSLGVDAAVEAVGLAANGDMAVPKQWDDVGWYDQGAVPGAPGNAVIDGHLDSYTGPAVFIRLRELKPGDRVIVVTASGAQLQFAVVESGAVTPDSAPLRRIFGPDLEPRLNLITCDGTWDAAKGQYDQRLVVYTKLVGAP